MIMQITLLNSTFRVARVKSYFIRLSIDKNDEAVLFNYPTIDLCKSRHEGQHYCTTKCIVPRARRVTIYSLIFVYIAQRNYGEREQFADNKARPAH